MDGIQYERNKMNVLILLILLQLLLRPLYSKAFHVPVQVHLSGVSGRSILARPTSWTFRDMNIISPSLYMKNSHRITTEDDCMNRILTLDRPDGSFGHDPDHHRNKAEVTDDVVPTMMMKWMNMTDLLPLQQRQQYRLPPLFVEDWNVLYYDIFLIINLVVSISFWVVHRLDISYIGIAFNEGCLLSLLWIVSGLFNGSFLYSAIDGHQLRSSNNNNSILNMRITRNQVSGNNSTLNATSATNDIGKTKLPSNGGGPMAAGLLALHTYINTMNLRLVWALILAVLEHRSALSNASELLIPLEFGYGLVLMILWRTLHSSYVLR